MTGNWPCWQHATHASTSTAKPGTVAERNNTGMDADSSNTTTANSTKGQARRKRIAEGEENLKKIAADIEAAETTKAEIISEANSKADTLIGEARESAEGGRE